MFGTIKNNPTTHIIGPNTHAIETTFMLLNEKRYGENIYTKIFTDD